MSLMQRVMVRHGHPRHMIVALLSTIWSLYFMWAHQWEAAAAVAVAGVVVANLATMGVRAEKLGETLWGRMLLLHLHPFNVTAQVVGYVILLYAFWEHSPLYMLIGTSVILLGHICGWHKVDASL